MIDLQFIKSLSAQVEDLTLALAMLTCHGRTGPKVQALGKLLLTTLNVRQEALKYYIEERDNGTRE